MIRALPSWTPIVLVLMMADLAAGFETTMMFAALPKLMLIFGNPIGVGWLISGYFLCYASATAIIGRLGDIYGRKRVLLGVLMLVVVGSSISAMGASLEWVIAGRVLQGVSGGILPLCLGLARENVPDDKVSLSVGILLASSGVGGALGLVVGGLIIDNAPWPYLFVTSGAMTLATLLLAPFVLPASAVKAKVRTLDLAGGFLFTSAIAAILFAVSNMREWGVTDERFLMVAGSGLGLTILWICYEYRQQDPLLDVRLFAQKEFALLSGCFAIFGLGGMQLAQIQMLFLQQPVWTGAGLGLSATLSGLLKVPSNVISMGTAPATGYFVDRLGGRPVLITAFLLGCVGWALLTAKHDSIWLVVTVLALVCNLSSTMLLVGLSAVGVTTAPVDRTGETMGLLTVVRSVGMALGSQLTLVILAADRVYDPAHPSSSYPTEWSFSALFLVLIALSFTGAVLAWFLPGSAKRAARLAQEGVGAA